MEKSLPDQQKDFELIGRFHEFELTGEELVAFEKRLEEDPVFQERFRLYGQMDQHIDEQFPRVKAADFKALLKDIPEKGNSAGKIRQLLSRRQWGVAATIALLLTAGLWWLFSPGAMDDPLALAEHYWNTTDKAHLFAGNQRGEDTADPNERAYLFFRSIRDLQAAGQYKSMIDELEQYKTTTPTPIPFEDDADWLLAIAYLANDELENARQTLERIIGNYPARREKARQLLRDIEQLETEGKVEK